MKRKLFWGLATVMLTTVLFVSCSKVPQNEIDAANAAIQEAKMEGAEVYKNDEYITLQDSMRSVMINVENQNSKFIKNYGSEKKKLEQIISMAHNLKQQTVIKKEEIKHEIQNSIAQVNLLIETNKKLITEAPKGKEGTTALLSIKSELDAIELALTDAKLKFEDGEYLTSLNMVKASKDKATSINEELNAVINKYKANQKGKKS